MSRKLSFFIFALLVLVGSSIGASTVIKLDLAALVKYSDLIVVGQVKSTRVFESNGKILTSIIISEEKVLKGAVPEKIEIVQYGGRTEKLTSYVPGMPTFVESERVLLFLEKAKKRDTYVVTGMSQGKFKVATGPDGLNDFVVPVSLNGMELVQPTKSSAVESDVHTIVNSLKSLTQKINALQK